MNNSSNIPIFGNKLAGQTYIDRLGAYAVIRDAQLRIATLRVGTAFFLPGGGSGSDETPWATLHREIMEECGRTVQIGSELGKAIEYLYAKNEGVYYQIRSTFFEAMFMDGQVNHTEDNHILVWLSVSEAIQHLHRQSQAWAVQQFVGRTVESRPCSEQDAG
jgi:8-oxo-dGTP diphosphatase